MNMRQQMAKGAIWSFIERAGQQTLSFILFTVLARFVGPDAFGLVNLCYVYMAFTSFVLLGIPDGIISLKLQDDRVLSSLFWTIMLCAASLSLGGIALTGPLSLWVGDDRIAPLMRLIAIIPLLQGLSAIPTFMVMARMDFRVFTMRTLIATFCAGLVGVSLAVSGFGPYALAFQQITLYSVINLVLWRQCAFRPRFLFDRERLLTILLPGLKMTGSLFVTFMEQQMPRLLIGRFVGPTGVGFYAFGTNILFSVQEILIAPMAVVLYPAFAKMKERADEQRKIIGEIIQLAGFAIFPTITGAIMTAPLFVPLLFGQAWTPAIPVLQLLLVNGFIAPFMFITRDFLRAQNKTGSYLRVQSVIVMIEVALFIGVSPWGLLPMAGIVATTNALAFPVLIHLLARRAGLNLWPDLGRIIPALLSAGAMAVALYFYQHSALIPSQPWLALTSMILLGVVTYAGLTLLIARKQVRFLWSIAQQIIASRKRNPS